MSRTTPKLQRQDGNFGPPIDVFREEAIAKAARAGGQSDAETPQRALDQWFDAHQKLIATKVLPGTPYLDHLGLDLHTWFSPPEESIRAAGLKNIPWTNLIPDVKLPYLDPDVIRDLQHKLAQGQLPGKDFQLPGAIALCIMSCESATGPMLLNPTLSPRGRELSEGLLGTITLDHEVHLLAANFRPRGKESSTQ